MQLPVGQIRLQSVGPAGDCYFKDYGTESHQFYTIYFSFEGRMQRNLE